MLMLNCQTDILELKLEVEPEFDFLSPEYHELYSHSNATAFQAPLWMGMLNQKLAPRLSAKQYTITARRVGGGQLVAVMPLVIQRVRGVAMILPADFGLCDYNAVVANNAVLDRLARNPENLKRIAELVGEADLVMFRKVRADSFDVRRLFPKGMMSISEHAAYRCDFGSDLDAWRRTLAKSISNRLPRQYRQVEQQFGPYEHRRVRDETGIRDAFAFLKRVREGRFEGDLIEDPLYYDFYLEYAIASAGSGEAGLYVGYIDGQPVSFLFGLMGGRHFHAVQLGADRDRYSKYSVGNQIYYYAMQAQFNEGQTMLDMGIGDTGYKSDFRAVQIPMCNFTSANTLKGAAIATVYHRVKPLKNMLRQLAPRLH
ncbi:GNAT family N-acetyltransferase [Pseudorhizobium flavum]|uniref:CelD/BcsL family acetyltransferase involved in cellulose biosynthesis n=1 Tax=Pseudorhizobium flavum TaxID=1335061 RepID=A0A7X0DFQ1_9HYPH|nr:GNAT family N-acetyltransferase [Pseudorhizobium flavum]MBB6182346.1 CelD/BcsL family acetyltransferase involved in cellulose biosynthesis [Pseudorhizobium flavum]CAD6632037.1 GNAT family N-acetyltransferase [Pseudorhizobium flavum]